MASECLSRPSECLWVPLSASEYLRLPHSLTSNRLALQAFKRQARSAAHSRRCNGASRICRRAIRRRTC